MQDPPSTYGVSPTWKWVEWPDMTCLLHMKYESQPFIKSLEIVSPHSQLVYYILQILKNNIYWIYIIAECDEKVKHRVGNESDH